MSHIVETPHYQDKERVVIAMFMGQFDHTIDTKGRTIIPVKYRDELGDEFVVSVGPDGCLYLYPAQEWQKFMDQFQNLASNHNTRRVQRRFLANSMTVSLDKQGRILVPAPLRSYAGLEKDVVYIGMMNHIEVWDKNRLGEMDVQEDMESFESALDDLGISL